MLLKYIYHSYLMMIIAENIRIIRNYKKACPTKKTDRLFYANLQ